MISSTRLRGIALVIVLLPSSARAQTVAQSFDELQALLKPGQMVVVTDDKDQNTTGRISDLSATALALLVPGKPTSLGNVTTERREFPADAVNIIRRTDPLWNGTLMGLGIGAAAAAGWRHSCGDISHADRSDVDGVKLCQGLTTFFGFAGLVPIGTVMGWVIDRSTGDERVYLKRAKQRVVASTLVSTTGFGVRTSISF